MVMARSIFRSRPVFAMGSRLFSETSSAPDPSTQQPQEQGDPEVIDFIKKVWFGRGTNNVLDRERKQSNAVHEGNSVQSCVWI